MFEIQYIYFSFSHWQSSARAGEVKNSVSLAKQFQLPVSMTTEVCAYSTKEFSLLLIAQFCILSQSDRLKLSTYAKIG